MFKSKKKIFYWILVILWMMIIFYLSAQEANVSNNLSTGITKKIVTTINKVSPNKQIDIRAFNNIVRKNAHFIAYMILGFLSIMAIRCQNKLQSYRCIIYSFLLCIIYAISDEFHQSFVPGRGPSLKDVLIDSSGAIVGICIYIILAKLINKKRTWIFRR